jgi:hypothetical protein
LIVEGKGLSTSRFEQSDQYDVCGVALHLGEQRVACREQLLRVRSNVLRE